MLRAVFFDLDGTLLSMDEKRFLEIYFESLGRWLTDNGRDAKPFIDGTIAGTRAMFKNDGAITNEAVFWKLFKESYGSISDEDIALMDGYYDKYFEETFVTCAKIDESAKIVKFCREAGLKVVLSTNPLFPRVATLKRMAISDLYEEDFDLVTTFENSSYCKPNPKYFTDLLERFDLSPDEVILFGNNTNDDGECALGAGIKCYIIESKDLIESEKATHDFERIKITDVVDKIKENLGETNEFDN